MGLAAQCPNWGNGQYTAGPDLRFYLPILGNLTQEGNFLTIQDLCRDKKAALHMTAQDIADQSGVPLSTVNNFFANASKAPSINTAGPICATLGISIDEFFGITDKLTMSEEVLSAKNDTLRAHKKELEKHLVDNGKTMKIMMDGVRTRNRIIAALLVLLCLVAMYALYLDFHCVQIGFWRG
nr:MAG TPA: helix-turn-helix domain protein [Caudoviricetes sp.]